MRVSDIIVSIPKERVAVSVEALPGNTSTPPELMPSDTRWLSGVELVAHEERATLRSWLLTPGLLTQRIRAAAGTDFSMSVLREQTTASGHEREIDMRCAGVVWLFAHTSIPAATLSAQPWLGQIGNVALGEALAAHGGCTRADFQYARCSANHWLVHRALQHASLAPQSLWVRRSVITVTGFAFSLYEVFLPAIGERPFMGRLP